MDDALVNPAMALSPNQRLASVVAQQQQRLWAFVRRQVSVASDAEDIVQEVFAELLEAYRLMKPIERVGSWLMRVARNRLIDRYRVSGRTLPLEEDAQLDIPALIGADGSGPESEYRRALLADALEQAIENLPVEQRRVFVAHEIAGQTFKDIAAESGIPVNTLLGRKHAAVLQLRETLRDFYDELEW